MAEKRPRTIVQGKKTYVFTGTEELAIGATIWTRDRYDNVNGDPHSYLLDNFVDTHKPAKRGQSEIEETPKPREEVKKMGTNIRSFIQDWKAKQA